MNGLLFTIAFSAIPFCPNSQYGRGQDIVAVIDLKEVVESTSKAPELAARSRLLLKKHELIRNELAKRKKELEDVRGDLEQQRARREGLSPESHIGQLLKAVDHELAKLEKEAAHRHRRMALETQGIVLEFIVLLFQATEIAIEIKRIAESNIPGITVRIKQLFVKYEQIDPINASREFTRYKNERNLSRYVVQRIEAG